MDRYTKNIKKPSKPRKIQVIKPSKYDASESIHANKRYWKSVFRNLTEKERVEYESNVLKNALPSDIYEKVCETLNIPVLEQEKDVDQADSESKPRRLHKRPLLSYRHTICADRDLDSDTDVEFQSSSDEEGVKPNIFQEFLSKPVREQVTWPTRYLLPEREDEKNLVRKADDLTDRIAQEFCEFMKELGGDQQSQLFTPKAIKELFKIDFNSHAEQGLKVIPKEMPTVEDKIAIVTGNPTKSKIATLEREISKDIVAENRLDHLIGFGKSLPRADQWRALKNNTKSLWRSARHVPNDLVTLKTVWEGITNLRSVKEYCRWMIEHPEYKRPPYLSNLGMFDSAVLEARLTFESKKSIHLTSHSPKSPAPIDSLRTRLSKLADSSD